MERPLNLLRGCARIEICGARPVKTLERMAAAGVEFWRTEYVDEFTLRLSVRYRRVSKIMTLAELSQCTARVVGLRGLPREAKRMRKRAALSLCALALLAALTASSLFVWDVEVIGNERLSDGEILRALEDCGVKSGAFWPDFSAEAVRDAVMLRLPELRWMSLNFRSSRAEVIVREDIEKPELYDSRRPVDVISAATGIITKMTVLDGFPLKGVGSAVLPGETLVTGRWESPISGAVRYVHAKAEIEARTWYEITAQTSLETMKKDYGGGRFHRWALRIGEKRVNFYNSSGKTYGNCDKIVEEYPMALKGVFTLPLTLVRESCERYELVPVKVTVPEAEAELKAALLLELERRLDGRGEPVSINYSISQKNNILTVTLRAECIEDIALEIPIDPLSISGPS